MHIKLNVISAALLCLALHPLSAQSTAEMREQTREAFRQADSEMEKVYEALLARLPDAEAKLKLKKSQQAWVAFRDAVATFAADRVRGGSMAGLEYFSSMTESTKQRIKQVKQLESDYPE